MRTAKAFIVGCTVLTMVGWGSESEIGSTNESVGQCIYGEWSAPVNLGEVVNSAFNDSHAWITKNGLSLYITSTRVSKIATDEDIFVSQRSSLGAPWGTPVRLGPNVNTVGFNDSAPSITEDGHDMYFHSPRPGGCGAADIYVSHRIDTTDDFGWQPAVNLGCVVNGSGPENGPVFFQANGTDYLYYLQTNPIGGLGGADIVVSTRPTGTDTTWGAPVPVTQLNSALTEGRSAIRRTDGLEFYVSSNRVGTFGGQDIWVSTRPSLSSPWSNPVNLGPSINTIDEEGAPELNFDATVMIFYSTRPGGSGMRDLYMSTRSRICRPTALCQSVSVSANSSCQASASINAGSSNNDTDDDSDTTCTQSPAGPYALGATQVTLTCKDSASQLTATCIATVTVVDTTPPVIVCPANQALECTDEGEVATFTPTASDNCGVASVQCSPPSGTNFPEDPSPTSDTCVAVDSSGNQASCAFQVNVKDSLPPVVTTNPGDANGFIALLWPPNHDYHTVSLADCIQGAADQCDASAELMSAIVGVSSDEAELGHGSGHTDADIVIADDGSSVQLRAERNGNGDGRVYEIFAVVSDDEGNATHVSCRVAVPHDQSGAPAVDSGTAYCVGSCN